MEVKETKKLFCEICSLQFDKKNVYNIHMSFAHKKEQSKSIEVEALIQEKSEDLGQDKEHTESSTNCSICAKSFSTKYNLKNHIEAIHEGKKPHKCPICDKSTAEKGSLKKHIELVHEGKKPHKCSICDYNFSNKGA